MEICGKDNVVPCQHFYIFKNNWKKSLTSDCCNTYSEDKQFSKQQKKDPTSVHQSVVSVPVSLQPSLVSATLASCKCSPAATKNCPSQDNILYMSMKKKILPGAL